MRRLIEFNLDSTGQTKVLVEADDPDGVPQGQVRVAASGVAAEQASKAFDAALAGIKPVAAAVMREVTAAVADAIAVEFGIKLTANAGIIIAGTSAEGNCKISIKWSRKP
jgi:hypothetical protein